jgi:hypothetical protein
MAFNDFLTAKKTLKKCTFDPCKFAFINTKVLEMILS